MSDPIIRVRDAARTIIESGRALRIVVDGRRRDVRVPARVRAAHGAQLVLDVTRHDATDVSLAPDVSAPARAEATLDHAGDAFA